VTNNVSLFDFRYIVADFSNQNIHMSSVGRVGEGPVSQFVILNKQRAEQIITSKAKETLENPEKTIEQLQQPSPLGQFLDIKL
jgi:hypothetical protein